MITVAVAVPAFVLPVSRQARRAAIAIGLIDGIDVGYFAWTRHREFLKFFKGRSFGEVDPVFHHDLSFYVFKLPAIQTMINFAILLFLTLLVASIAYGWVARRTLTPPAGMPRITARIGAVFNPLASTAFVLVGVALALRTWIERYDVVLRSNSDSHVFRGAENLDVTGSSPR